jgi:hypothetical protein
MHYVGNEAWNVVEIPNPSYLAYLFSILPFSHTIRVAYIVRTISLSLNEKPYPLIFLFHKVLIII